MDVITSPKIVSIYNRLVADYPHIHFETGHDFRWSSDTRSIIHPEIKTIDDIFQVFHEIGHAELDHHHYPSDAVLVDMEAAAWQYAKTELAPKYTPDCSLPNTLVDDSLDSYRKWLHDRSVCPHCEAVGVEKKPGEYFCLSCRGNWHVNEARNCQLRRYKK